MFELSVEREFCAAHAIVIHGRREPVHGHNWRVRVVIDGERLDANGLLYDFHALERHVDRAIGSFHNADLNSLAPFQKVNPTAEAVTRHIAQAVAQTLPASVHLVSVSVTEAPGCTATYRPPESEKLES